MKKEFEALKKFLDDNNLTYKVSTHPKVHTSEEAAKIRGVPLKSGVKALVLKAEEKYYMILVPGDKKMDFSKLGLGKVRLADPKVVLEKTGCEIGSVHPFGNLFGLEVLMDEKILENETVNFSAGTHNESINMDPKDIVKSVKPKMGDYTQ